MLEHPRRGLPDVLVHGRGNAANHPAVAVAVTHLGAHLLRLLRIPQLVPSLGVQVAHDLLVPGTVAGHHVAVGVYEKGVEGHVAGKKARLAVDVVDEPVVEVGAEPLFGLVGLQQLIHQVLEVLGHHGAVMDDVLGLHEVEAVVQAGSCELHAQLVGYLVQRHQVGGVSVLHRHAEAHVGVLQLNQPLQGLVAALVAVLKAADLVVGLLQPLDGDADAHLRELLAKVDDAVGEEAVGGNHDAVRLLVQLANNLLQVGPDEGLASRDVGEVHLGELLYRPDGQLLIGAAGGHVAVAHRAPRIAAVRHDDGAVELLVCHVYLLLLPSFT